MKRTILFLSISFVLFTGLKADSINNEIVSLAKIYSDFMFRNNPPELIFTQLEDIKSAELTASVKFIKEAITINNNLAKEEFLSLPDEQTLKFIYIIRRVNWNFHEENPVDNNELINTLIKTETVRYELIDCYYDMLFCGIGNKNRPFDMSDIDFVLSKYELKDETEKGIFFLQAMDLCGTNIWGYMNIVKPPNYKLAMEFINKFPKFNGQPYYQFMDFNFPDFEMVIITDNGKESYKSYYLNKYYNTLLSHLECLSQKKKDKEARTDLLLGSILKEERYYKYSKKKSVLESLFTTIEN